jgi:hypothetical protein
VVRWRDSEDAPDEWRASDDGSPVKIAITV